MVSTRSQVREVQQKALVDRNDSDREIEIAVTTPSDTGEGTHIRWQHLKVSQDDLHEMLSGLKLKEPRDSESFSNTDLHSPQEELPRAATSLVSPKRDQYSTPNSSRPVTPSTPKRPTCRPPTPTTPTKTKSKAKMLFTGGSKGSYASSEEAPRKGSEAELERRIHDRENKKRVYKLITTSRPDLLREAKRDLLRVDSKENNDPFL